jgi:RNA polymerase sigma factor (sigma-70 family)
LVSEPDLSSSNGGTLLPSPRDTITAAINNQFNLLRTSIQVLVARSGLAEGKTEIDQMADEVLQTTVEDALRGADIFDPSRSAYAWLLGIANYKIVDMQRAHFKERKRALSIESGVPRPVSALHQTSDPESQTPEDRLDAALYHSGQRDRLIDRSPFLEEMLSLVDANDRKLLTLVYVEGLDGIELAAALGIREGAAYVRVARARDRLRQKFLAAEGLFRKEL